MAQAQPNPGSFARDDLNALLSSSTLIKPEIAEAVEQRIAGWETRLTAIEVALQRDLLKSAELTVLQTQIFAIETEAATLVDALTPMLTSIEQRLASLALPEDGTIEESDTLAKQRRELSQMRSRLTGFIKQSDVLQLQADDLLDRIAAARRNLLERQLFARTHSLLDPSLWNAAALQVPGMLKGTTLLLGDWLRLIAQRAVPPAVAVAAVILIAAAVLVWPIRRRLANWADRPEDVTEPSEVRRSVAALAIVCLSSVLPLVVASAIFLGFNALDLSPSRIDTAMVSVFTGIVAYTFVRGLTWAILAPGRPGWRLLPVSDEAVRHLMRYSTAVAILLALAFTISGLLRVMSANGPAKELLSGLLAVSIGIATVLVLRRMMLDNGGTDDGAGSSAQTGSSPRGSLVWPWVVSLFWITAIVAVAAPVLGRIWLGWFLAVQIVWSLAIFLVMHLLLRVVDSGFVDLFTALSPLGRMLNGSMALRASTVEQLGVILSGLLRLILLGLAVFAILLPWGFSTGDVSGMARDVLSGLQIGSITVSPSGLISALAILIVVIGLTRAVKGWLENRLLPRTSLDVGLKSSISTTFGYVGYIIAALLGLSAAGLSLQNIAIVAGALSVGIGLGLQGIVNNFVSGLILLAERPIKVGDWVVVGSEQGYVRRINVRATEIETFDRAAVMIPNSNLISGVVKNWMHGNTMGRVSVPVGVSYAADPEQVREILLGCAREHPKILAYPAPAVFFMDFGASSLDFELRCFLSNVDYSLTVASELRFAVWKRLCEEGIEIPFPQQDLHIRDIDKLADILRANGTRSNRGPLPPGPQPFEKDPI